MKITNVEVLILEGPEAYRAPDGAEEAPGVRHLCLVKVSTDEGLVGRLDFGLPTEVTSEGTGGYQYFSGRRLIRRGDWIPLTWPRALQSNHIDDSRRRDLA